MEPRVEIKEHMRGGKGHVIMKHLFGEKELNGKCRIYAEITLEPGCEIGYHEHHNESEKMCIRDRTNAAMAPITNHIHTNWAVAPSKIASSTMAAIQIYCITSMKILLSQCLFLLSFALILSYQN